MLTQSWLEMYCTKEAMWDYGHWQFAWSEMWKMIGAICYTDWLLKLPLTGCG